MAVWAFRKVSPSKYTWWVPLSVTILDRLSTPWPSRMASPSAGPRKTMGLSGVPDLLRSNGPEYTPGPSTMMSPGSASSTAGINPFSGVAGIVRPPSNALGSARVDTVTMCGSAGAPPSGSDIVSRTSYSVAGSRNNTLPANRFPVRYGPYFWFETSWCTRSIGRASLQRAWPLSLKATATEAFRLLSPSMYHRKPKFSIVGGSMMNRFGTILSIRGPTSNPGTGSSCERATPVRTSKVSSMARPSAAGVAGCVRFSFIVTLLSSA